MALFQVWLCEDTESVGVYCVLTVSDNDPFFQGVPQPHRFPLQVVPSLRRHVNDGADTGLRVQHKKAARITSAIF